MITKTPGWERRMMSKSSALLNREFHWGISDCVMISLILLDAMCETSWWLEGRNRWANKLGAIKYRQKHGSFYDWLVEQGAVQAHRRQMGDFVCGEIEGLENTAVLLDPQAEVVITSNELEGKVGLTSLSAFESYKLLRISAREK